MEFVGGGELISLIVKERGFGEKRSWFVSQLNPTAVNSIASTKGAFWGASVFSSSERHLRFKLGRGLGRDKRAS